MVRSGPLACQAAGAVVESAGMSADSPSEPTQGSAQDEQSSPSAPTAERSTLNSVKQSFSRALLHTETIDDREAVVKDFSSKGWLFRCWIGPFLLGREERAYAALCGLEGFPGWYRRLNRQTLAVERIRGEVLSRELAGRHGRVLFAALAETVDRMHAAGIVHLDLHQKRNILVRDDGRPVLIDFASSFRFGTGSAFSRWLVRTIGRADRACVIKFKARYVPELLTEDERARANRSRLLSWIWIFRPLNAGKKHVLRAVRKRRARGRDGDSPPHS